MKRIKKVAVAIVYILLALILTYNIYNFVNIRILENDMTTIGGYSMLEVVSGSMEPNIHIGDMIIIDTEAREFNANDIVTFYDENGSFVTHRIISRTGDMVITQGDNNDSPDPEFHTSKIVGKYVFKIHGLGFLLKAFQSPMTMVLILIIGVLVCVLVSTDSEGNPIKSEEEKEFEEFLKAKNELEIKPKENLEITKEIVRKPIKRPKKAETTEQIEQVEEKVSVVSKTIPKKTTTTKKTNKATDASKEPVKKTSTKTSKTVATSKKTANTKSNVKTTAKSTTKVKTDKAKVNSDTKTVKKVATTAPKKVEGKKTTKTTTKSSTTSSKKVEPKKTLETKTNGSTIKKTSEKKPTTKKSKTTSTKTTSSKKK